VEKARVEARARGRTSHPSMTSNGQDRVEMKTVSFSPHRSWCRIRALAGVRARLRDKHGGQCRHATGKLVYRSAHLDKVADQNATSDHVGGQRLPRLEVPLNIFSQPTGLSLASHHGM